MARSWAFTSVPEVEDVGEVGLGAGGVDEGVGDDLGAIDGAGVDAVGEQVVGLEAPEHAREEVGVEDAAARLLGGDEGAEAAAAALRDGLGAVHEVHDAR